MPLFSKQPPEQYTIGFDFAGKLPTGTSLASGSVAAVDAAGADVSATILGSTTAGISGTKGTVLVKAGTAGVRYKITFLMTLSNGDKLEEDVSMDVVQN